MPAESVTVSLSWWKLDSAADMFEALTELHEGSDFRGSVGVYPSGPEVDASPVWQLQFSKPDVGVAVTAGLGDVVAAVGSVVEVLSPAAFTERYPGIALPGV